MRLSSTINVKAEKTYLPLPDPLPIRPYTVAPYGCVTPPGSKSITNRALILAALSPGTTTIENALFSRDTEIMVTALQQLGIRVAPDRPAGRITVSGCGGDLPIREARFNVGNAGTAARFFTALLSLKAGGSYHLDGDPAMRRRPMKGLLDALVTLGAEVEYEGAPGFFPFHLRTAGLHGGSVSVDASASSQMLSALLLVAPFAQGRLEIQLQGKTVSQPFVSMTLGLLKRWGWAPETLQGRGNVFGGAPPPEPPFAELWVEPDATAASYFMILPRVVSGAVTVRGLGAIALQGDIRFAEVLERLGVKRRRQGDDLAFSYNQSLHETGDQPMLQENLKDISDTFLTLAAIAPLLPAPTQIEGIGHTRRQETDRINAVATELRKLGQEVRCEEDAIEIRPDLPALRRAAHSGVTISTYDDHRIAMSFAILGCADLRGNGQPWLFLQSPENCRKTYPGFFHDLQELRFRVIAIDGGAASGKSTTAKALAKALHLLHVDTGSFYRAVTLLLLRYRLRADEPSEVEEFLEGFQATSEILERSVQLILVRRPYSRAELRAANVNEEVSSFAALPEVRRFLLRYQRSLVFLAREKGYAGLIMEGRDIGSVIFPDADFKFFLEADETTRFDRRAGEGQEDAITLRDQMDATRKTAPMVCPRDAIRIDTSKLSIAEVVESIRSSIAGRAQ